jgi:putative transcriptional regulator
LIEIRLRELLAARHESLAELARATGLSYSTVHRLYSGHAKRVDLGTLERLCAYLDVGPGRLLEWRGGRRDISPAVRQKMRQWPETKARLDRHLADQERRFGIQPDSTDLIRDERAKREQQLADLS